MAFGENKMYPAESGSIAILGGLDHRPTTLDTARHEITRLEQRLVAMRRAEAFLIANPELNQFIDDLKELGLR